MRTDYKDMIGNKFDMLTVIDIEKDGRRSYAVCKCDCGNVKRMNPYKINKGVLHSCGCSRGVFISDKKFKHGYIDTRPYHIWEGMKTRCYNKNSASYEYYGGRGIEVCAEWRDNPEKFVEWTYSNHDYDDTKEIDRVDVNGNYSPENCRWVSKTENANNKRNNLICEINGVTKTVAQWCDEFELDRKLVYNRIEKYGWSIERSLNIDEKLQ